MLAIFWPIRFGEMATPVEAFASTIDIDLLATYSHSS